MRTLIDSSVFIAAARPSEALHAVARKALEAHQGPGTLASPVTIVAETMSFIGTRFGVERQRDFWDAFMDSGIELVPVDEELVRLAREIDRRYRECSFGFADCTLLASCETLATARVLSFDSRLASYRPSFAPALEVLP